jgi:cytochrome c-type biogenesis protein CcmH/NrfG
MGITPLLLGTLIASTAATVGTGIYEAVAAPQAPQAPTQAQTAQQMAQASQAAALAQAQALTQRRGMASTILASPLGTSGTASTQKATLGA